MKKRNWFSNIALVLLVLLAVFGCSAGQQESVSATQQAITTTCTTDADCTGGVAPACGNAASGICVGAGLGGVKACNYSLNWAGTSTCQCLEGDVQSCKTGAQTYYDGIQTCTVTSSSPVTTNWGTCAVSSTGFSGQTTVSNSVRNCSGTLDCDNAPDRPVCADWDERDCQRPGTTGPKQCLWRRANETGCNCILNDIRSCTIYGGGPGHQMCLLTGNGLVPNDWGYSTGWQICQ